MGRRANNEKYLGRIEKGFFYFFRDMEGEGYSLPTGIKQKSATQWVGVGRLVAGSEDGVGLGLDEEEGDIVVGEYGSSVEQFGVLLCTVCCERWGLWEEVWWGLCFVLVDLTFYFLSLAKTGAHNYFKSALQWSCGISIFFLDLELRFSC